MSATHPSRPPSPALAAATARVERDVRLLRRSGVAVVVSAADECVRLVRFGAPVATTWQSGDFELDVDTLGRELAAESAAAGRLYCGPMGEA